MPALGAIAAGHPATAEAAEHALRAGGNAFDAVISALWCACAAEPVLTSLGGGGFLMARPAGQAARVYDFFAHTPRRKRRHDTLDFHPIHADFGTTSQEFHIGYGSVATPGTVKGLFHIHRQLGSLPMRVLMEAAIDQARRGVRINGLQAFIFDVVRPIYLATEAAARLFASRSDPTRLVQEGETLRQPALADTLEALSRDGDQLFYEGDIARLIAEACREQGGHLDREDLSAYRVVQRQPLRIGYRRATLFTNPPPSSGGLLIAFALKLLEPLAEHGNTAARLPLLARVMAATNQARADALAAGDAAPAETALLDAGLLERYRAEVLGRARANRGTTHISVIDRAGNVASLTASNGEGCGHMLGDTGIMLNNMLGEEDLNPVGFHRWRQNQRLTSMMAPSLLVLEQGQHIALGSGGSNRIRSAILQVLLQLVEQETSLQAAVDQPRLHYEAGLLNIESGYEEAVYEQLRALFGPIRTWPDRNLFFGGVHAVMHDGKRFECAGDRRRGGVALIVNELQ